MATFITRQAGFVDRRPARHVAQEAGLPGSSIPVSTESALTDADPGCTTDRRVWAVLLMALSVSTSVAAHDITRVSLQDSAFVMAV